MGQSAGLPEAPPVDVIEGDVDAVVLAVVEVTAVDRVGDGAGLPDPKQPASANASTNTVAATRTPPITLRSRRRTTPTPDQARRSRVATRNAAEPPSKVVHSSVGPSFLVTAELAAAFAERYESRF
jgi:hypothetical protein